jgi:hypothetical protein
LLPVPHDGRRARALLAPLSERARVSGGAPSDAELLDAALAAYELSLDAVAPLVAWLT